MAIVNRPGSELPSKLKGLHLFHYGGAPCAQRVRFVLAEKGIRRGPDVPWRSDVEEHLEAPAGTYIGRPVSLPRQENLSEPYAAIHPNLVVPALVHDGVLHIESVDIMNYVDQELTGPALIPEGERGGECRALVKRASELQPSVRYVTYRWSLGGLAKLSPRKQAELQRIDSADSPEQLADFYRRFSNGEISEDTFAGHVASLSEGFREIERLLADGRAWLCGETFSMADIIWVVKVQRIDEAGYPFAASFPQLKAWFDRARTRPGFREAIGHDLGAASRFMRVRGAVQNFLGRGLQSAATG
ncbi:MAG: glutathione S-transferase family protein [bacterium]|nr:glutathione S-transferase family protein [bacterium]